MKVEISLLGNKMKVDSGGYSQEKIWEVVKHIENQIASLKHLSKTEDTLKLAGLALLQVTSENFELKEKGSKETAGYNKEIVELNSKLEEELNG